MNRQHALIPGLLSVLVLAALGVAVAARAAPVRAAAGRVVYAAPDGSGGMCTAKDPCSVVEAQSTARRLTGKRDAPVVVQLAGGTYRLSASLKFTDGDSGSTGNPVTWRAAPGARPVLSGAVQVTGWKQVDAAKGVWQAKVPTGLDTRQVYVDGQEAPIAQTTPAEQKVTFAAAPGGYATTPATWAASLQAQIGAAAMHGVEFVYTGGNGPWTQSRCRIDTLSGSTTTMQQPCWNNVTSRPTFSQASGGLPSMSPGTAPSLIENAYPLLHPGQWYLDRQNDVLDYIPTPGQQMSGLDVEVPRLASLITGAGTLAHPVHDITFTGIQMSYATWLDPSTDAGFADVQDNLTLTGSDPARPQGTCTFGTPPGTCPFGALTREPGNMSWSAAHHITFDGDTFSHLGAAGLVFDYGSQHNTVEDSTFADIAGNAIILGNTNDPHPGDVGAGNAEINAYNTVQNNVIHNIGTDYPSAAGITMFFTQHTTIAHNELYDLPYTGITAGVIQGHVDNAAHPDNTTNINSDNTISDNLIHGFMQVLHDGGAIYVEGHQGQTLTARDGSVDRAASIAHGLTVSGNVAYDQGNVNFTWYDDAGSEWINWTGNVEWDGGSLGQGGCESTGHLDYTGNYSSDPIAQWACSPPAPVDTTISSNATLPTHPGAADLPLSALAAVGPTPRSSSQDTSQSPAISYAQRPAAGAAAAVKVLIAGRGFTDAATVSFGGTRAAAVAALSPGFLLANAPAGAALSTVTVTTAAGTATASTLTGTVNP